MVSFAEKKCDFFAKSPIVNYYGRNKHLSERETQKHYGKGKLKSHCCVGCPFKKIIVIFQEITIIY
jgi:hypothetical protein